LHQIYSIKKLISGWFSNTLESRRRYKIIDSSLKGLEGQKTPKPKGPEAYLWRMGEVRGRGPFVNEGSEKKLY